MPDHRECQLQAHRRGLRGLAVLRWAGSLLLPLSGAVAQTVPPTVPPAAAQNPSPMAEQTRLHARLASTMPTGTLRRWNGPVDKPIELFIPSRVATKTRVDVVIHFHGAAFIPAQAVAARKRPTVAAVMTLGSGSGVYDRSYRDPAAFDTLLAQITRELAAARGAPVAIGKVVLAGWSAGHGAIRAILRDSRHMARVHGVLLIDGMHTSYVPEGQPMANGGALDTTNLVALTAFARAAVAKEKRMLVTHSEIFPGTFASTTETAEWMLAALGVKRRAVLAWGARGMQQLSEAHAGQFTLLGYAGNSAPDHVDELHAMPELLQRLLGR